VALADAQTSVAVSFAVSDRTKRPVEMSAPGENPATNVAAGSEQPFATILVGSDGTGEGQDAVALGAALASITGAGLLLVRVFPTPLFPTPGSTDRATLREQADKGLQHDRDQLAPQALINSLADDSVPRALLHFAERTHAGLVVIGSAPGPEDSASIDDGAGSFSTTRHLRSLSRAAACASDRWSCVASASATTAGRNPAPR